MTLVVVVVDGSIVTSLSLPFPFYEEQVGTRLRPIGTGVACA